MRYRVGVGRARVADDGTVVHVLRGEDVLELDVPEDGSEFLSTLWLSTDDGTMLLSLPLALAPGLKVT